MKRTVPLILYICITAFAFTGCKSTFTNETNITTHQEENSGAFQELYDRSYTAKEFAESSFSDYMNSNDINNYTIEQINYGFIASELPVYIVGIKYSTSDGEGYYGYKISVDDSSECAVIEEGKEIADFIFK